MADGLSIAASAIQCADAGFKLYGALSQYIRDYVEANKHVKRLADEVRTTAWALQQLGALLKDDDELKLCKPEAITETEAALRGCQGAFDEVSEIIKDFLPVAANGPISKRWKWPLKKAKVNLLLAQLERLKTTLLLVFKVLSLASRLAAKTTKTTQNDMVLLDEKTQLTHLVKARHDATIVEERMLATAAAKHDAAAVDEKMPASADRRLNEKTLASANMTPLLRGRQASDPIPSAVSSPSLHGAGERGLPQRSREMNDQSASLLDPPQMVPPHNIFVGAAVLPQRFNMMTSMAPVSAPDKAAHPAAPQRPASKRALLLATQLDRCAAAVEHLALALAQAKEGLRLDSAIHLRPVTKSFRSIKRSVDELIATELDADSEEAHSHDDLLARRLPSRRLNAREGHSFASAFKDTRISRDEWSKWLREAGEESAHWISDGEETEPLARGRFNDDPALQPLADVLTGHDDAPLPSPSEHAEMMERLKQRVAGTSADKSATAQPDREPWSVVELTDSTHGKTDTLPAGAQSAVKPPSSAMDSDVLSRLRAFHDSRAWRSSGDDASATPPNTLIKRHVPGRPAVSGDMRGTPQTLSGQRGSLTMKPGLSMRDVMAMEVRSAGSLQPAEAVGLPDGAVMPDVPADVQPSAFPRGLPSKRPAVTLEETDHPRSASEASTEAAAGGSEIDFQRAGTFGTAEEPTTDPHRSWEVAALGPGAAGLSTASEASDRHVGLADMDSKSTGEPIPPSVAADEAKPVPRSRPTCSTMRPRPHTHPKQGEGHDPQQRSVTPIPAGAPDDRDSGGSTLTGMKSFRQRTLPRSQGPYQRPQDPSPGTKDDSTSPMSQPRTARSRSASPAIPTVPTLRRRSFDQDEDPGGESDFYEHRVVERERAPRYRGDGDGDWTTEVRSRRSALRYSSDDSYEYVRPGRRRRGRSESAPRRRRLAGAAIGGLAGAAVAGLAEPPRLQAHVRSPLRGPKPDVASAASGAVGAEAVRWDHSGRHRSRSRSRRRSDDDRPRLWGDDLRAQSRSRARGHHRGGDEAYLDDVQRRKWQQEGTASSESDEDEESKETEGLETVEELMRRWTTVEI
ncbi:hypothetical protein LTR53_012086 [Teratosphaeriaceae sp. CCFEE 6253]|nr:hypothetical protein LTR53_012086 [Teratosphaeriaceae sp. CCFEE 6253]